MDATTYPRPHTTCGVINAAGERLDADGSHCVRCACSQCTDED